MGGNLAPFACKSPDVKAPSTLQGSYDVILGSLFFAVFVVLNSLERARCLPVGRLGSTMVAAFLMLAFQVLNPDAAYSAIGCNLPLLSFVWGSMVLAHYLTKQGGFLFGIEAICMWRAMGPWDTCFRLSIMTSFTAAFLGWDIAALALAPLSLDLALRWRGKATAKPFLVAVATASNAGSCLTPISNPGNVIVVLGSGMSFAGFTSKMIIPWVIAVLVNAFVVVACYTKQLNLLCHNTHHNIDSDTNEDSSSDSERAPESGVEGTGEVENQVDLPEEGRMLWSKQQTAAFARTNWRGIFVYFVWLLALALWFANFELGIVAICAGTLVIVKQWSEAAPEFEHSSEWPVVIYITGIFMVVTGFAETGVPGAFWEWVKDYTAIDNFLGILLLIFVLALFTNVVTNVPAVLLLGSHVAAANENLPGGSSRGWLFVAFVVCMCGSFTANGSITQVITYDIGKADPGGTVGFLEHMRVGVPVTILTVACGLPFVFWLSQ